MAGVFTYDIRALPVGMTLEDGPSGRLLVVGLPANSDGSESNASIAGIEVGDTLVAVDADNISRLSFDDSIDRLRRAQIPIRITVARPTPEIRDQLLAEVAQGDADYHEEDQIRGDKNGVGEDDEDDEEEDDDADDEEDDEDDEDEDEDDDDREEDDLSERDGRNGRLGDDVGAADSNEQDSQTRPSQPGILYGMDEVFGDPSGSGRTPMKNPQKNKLKKKKKKKHDKMAKSPSVMSATREPSVEIEESAQAISDAIVNMKQQSEESLRHLVSDFNFMTTCWKNPKDVRKWANAAVWKSYTKEEGLTYEERHLRMQQARRLEKFWRDEVERGNLIQKALLALGVEFTLQYLGVLNAEGKRPGEMDNEEKSPRNSSPNDESSNPVIQEVAEQLMVTPCLVDVRSEEFETRIKALVEKVEMLHESANVQGRHLDRLVIELERHAGVFEAQVSHVAGLLGRRSQIIRERVEYLLASRQRHQFTVFQMRAALGRPLSGPGKAAGSGGTPEENGEKTEELDFPVPELSTAEAVEAESVMKAAEEAVADIEQALDSLLPETGLVQLYTGRENTMRRQYVQQRLEAKTKFTTLAQRYAEMLQVGEIQKAEFTRLQEEAAQLLSGSTKDIEEIEEMGYKIQLALPPAEIEDCIKQLPEQTVEQVQTWAKRKFALPTQPLEGAEAQMNGVAPVVEKKRPSESLQGAGSDTKRQRTSM